MVMQPIAVPRQELERALGNPRVVKAIENALAQTVDNANAVEGLGAAAAILVGPSAALPSGRVLTAGQGIAFTDSGPGGTFEARVASSGVAAGTYGSASQVSRITFDVMGRATAADAVTIAITALQISNSTATGRALLTAADAAAARAAIDAQQANANLSAIAGLVTAADRVIYWTGAGTAALATFTGFGRTLVASADAAAARTALDVPSRSGADASGTWGISITGNAATAATAVALSSNTAYVVQRSTILSSARDSATTSGIYPVDYGASSSTMVTFLPAITTSTDAVQFEVFNTGGFNYRNRLNGTTWNGWRTVVNTDAAQTLTNKIADALELIGITNLSGGRIKFPATQIASSDPNTLDDYEEGTWTPAFGATTTGPTLTYGTRTGRYTKIGNLVTCFFSVAVSGLTSAGSGVLTLSLPIAADNAGSFYPGTVAVSYATGFATRRPTGGYPVGSALYLTGENGAATIDELTVAQLSGSMLFTGIITYFAA